MVYVLSFSGQPLMPTSNHAKVRCLLKDGKAKVVRRCPFTIQLQYESTSYVQPVTLGVDAGSKHIGLSATTESSVLFESEVELRTDIVKLLSSRRGQRNARRYRKTRYRKARFNNRISSKQKGWLAPSIRHKVQTHIAVVDSVCKMLPIENIIVEVASFDIQRIKNPSIEGAEYQQGAQLGFWNVREYVLCRDNHKCQCCKGKSKDSVLNVHHIESRQTGGDAPDNLVTLCETCHKAYHAGKLSLPETIRKGKSFSDAAFMGIMRWAFYNKLKEAYPNVSVTYGYITKNTRIENGLPKTHCIDARCISGHPNAEPNGEYFYQKKVRCHNRQLHKAKIIKGGVRKNNQAPKYVFGFQLFDKVSSPFGEAFIFGRRTSGSFDIRSLGGIKLSPSISYKKLKLIEKRRNYIIERRSATSAPYLKAGVSVAKTL